MPVLGTIHTDLIEALAGTMFLAATAFILWLKRMVSRIVNRLEKGLPDQSIATTTAQDIKISALLAILQKDLHAQRVHVTRFSNGDHFLGGGSIIRMIRTHEWVRPGTDYQAENFRGMVVNTVANEIKMVLEEGHSWKMVTDLPDCKFRQLCEIGGTAAVARCAFFKGLDKDGKPIPIGYVGADFDTVDGPPRAIAELCKTARSVGIILSGVASHAVETHRESKSFSSEALPAMAVPA